jgi:hypothetical protein
MNVRGKSPEDGAFAFAARLFDRFWLRRRNN